MARIRTIKPEFFTDAKITSMAPLARLFYVSLWCEADRDGRLSWDLDTLKDRYLPRDKCDIEKLANELTQRKLIRLYEIDGRQFCDIPAFTKNQVINNREQPSTIPSYSDDACVTRESAVRDAACGKEGRKGREGKEGKADSYSQEFLDLKAIYPRRQGADPLPRAWEAFQAALKQGATAQILMTAAKQFAGTQEPDSKFTPQLATWLNGENWKAVLGKPAEPISINPERSQWLMRCKGFVKSGFWNVDQWGPKPNEDGCRAPREVIEETQAHLVVPDFMKRNLTMAG